MKNKNDNNIVKYQKKRKKIPVNPAVVFFAIVFVYLLIMIIKSFAQESLSVYEVVDGNISDKTEYSGIILRDEIVYNSSETGYINYYISDGKKAAVNNLIYTLDKNGEFGNILADAIQQNNISLSNESLNSLKADISDFKIDFSSTYFNAVYDINSLLKNRLHSYIEESVITDNLTSNTVEGIFLEHYADISGIVTYYVDGYEELTIDKLTSDHFTRKNYEKVNLTNGREIALWDPVFKLIKNDNWSVVFKPAKSELDRLSEMTTVSINFMHSDISTNAAVSTFTTAEGDTYVKLDFNRYMTEFINERFVDFEICYEETKGLKIPQSSVITKEVIKIPVQYASHGGSGQTLGFMKEVLNEDGTTDIKFVSGTIYKEDDFYYYIDSEELDLGDILIKEGINNYRYEICLTEALQGVYSINKGYAVFRRIYVLGEQEDYYIVQEGIRKGVSKNDHIALIGNKITDDQIIY